MSLKLMKERKHKSASQTVAKIPRGRLRETIGVALASVGGSCYRSRGSLDQGIRVRVASADKVLQSLLTGLPLHRG